MNPQTPILTSDRLIRAALKDSLEKKHNGDRGTRIIEELGINHGAARIDLAVVNGDIHGFELKSDKDTLSRLPDQMRAFNTVLDQATLVVGKNHIVEAINIVPEWWGIIVARMSLTGNVVSFYEIRGAGNNPDSTSLAVASLLWRDEALNILEEWGEADGVRSKTRDVVYARLAEVLDGTTLRARVRHLLRSRSSWRSETQCMPSDG
jgi:hypothetical protein